MANISCLLVMEELRTALETRRPLNGYLQCPPQPDGLAVTRDTGWRDSIASGIHANCAVLQFMRHGDGQTADTLANLFGTRVREIQPHVRAGFLSRREEWLAGHERYVLAQSRVQQLHGVDSRW